MLHVRDRQFLAGDRIILTRNAGLDPSPHRPRSCRVENATIGVIAALNPTTGEMTLETL